MSDMKIGARRYVFNQGDIVEEDALFVDAEDYEELVKEHDTNVLMLKAFQELFKQVEPEVARLRAALEFYGNKNNWLRDEDGWVHDMIICDLDDETLTDWDGRFSGRRAREALNPKPNLNDNPESEEEAY